jgi:anti-sigma factor RsiW
VSLPIETFRAQLVDYLYGELEGDALRAFEAKLAESAECRRELEALQETLTLAREGLRVQADEEPPARVRDAVLRAAAQPAKGEQASANAPAAQHATAEGGFWAWLRAPWLLPTLGVCAAVAVVVLGRRIETPQTERAADPRRDQGVAAPAAAHGGPPAGSKAGDPLVPAPASQGAPRAPAEDPRLGSPSSRAQSRGPGPLSTARQRSPASPGKGASPASSAAFDDADEWRAQPAPSADYAVPPPAWQPHATAEGSARREAEPSSRRASREAPPEELAPGAEPSEPTLRARAPSASSTSERPASGFGAAGSAHSTTSPAREPKVARAPLPQAAAPAPAKASPERAGRLATEAASDGDAFTDRDARAPSEQVERAQRHAAGQRWSEAAAAYRALLRHYPNDPRVPVWRRQLAAATRALGNVDGAR